ncbi:MAG: Cys-tRNA(Pro) deacylase [Ruminococcus sp.]|nr:Cys-tRNA(Pro) deacylase [Ruminococcus sp.]
MGKAKKDKDIKTNAMRFLDSKKIAYTVNTYECEDFVDGVHIAQMLGQDEKMSYKTLVTKGKSGGYFVFVLPVAQELDMKKAAKAVGEKSVEMLHVKDINSVTGYIRGGCSPLGMKKQFPTVVDASAQSFETIIISGGRLGSQILLAPQDLVTACGGSFGDIVFESV